MSRIPQYKPDDFKPILDIDWEEKSTAKKELNELDKLVTENQKLFLGKWNEYFIYKN